MSALISKALRALDDTVPLLENAGTNDDSNVDKDDDSYVAAAAASVDSDDENVMRGMARYIRDQPSSLSLFASHFSFFFSQLVCA
jgi:hypothetical protein